jgi:RNA-binding protein
LSTKARAHLRSLAHHLEPVVQIGHDGLTDAVIEAIGIALARHELIKVRIGQSFEGDRKPLAVEMARRTSSDLAQTIGRIVVLYKPRTGPADPKRPAIVLPAATPASSRTRRP